MGVIDGGADRGDMDRKLYGIADIVLLPFRASHEDIRSVRRDLDSFPRAYALPAQWPTSPWQRDSARKTIDQSMAQYKDRLPDPVTDLSATKLLPQRQLPDRLPTPLANACRRVAGQVLDLLRVTYEEPLEEPDGAPDGSVAADQTCAQRDVGAMPMG